MKKWHNISLIEILSSETEELATDYLGSMLSNKRSLVKKYGKDAEKIARGAAINRAKSTADKKFKEKLKEIIKTSLQTPYRKK